MIQAEYFMRTGHYVKGHHELSALVSHNEAEIIHPEFSDFDGLSQKLFAWAGEIVREVITT